MKNITFVIEKTGTGFSAYAKEYPVYTTGDTLDELKENMTDAINSWFENKKLPEVTEKDIKVVIDMPHFFKYYKELNAKALSKRIGMNETLMSQYVTGKKTPSPQQAERILKGIKSLGQELAALEFS
jgi:predicted RNase H-like HicB family nuclease